MSPEELKTETEQHHGPVTGTPSRPRRRRSGRGRHGRGRRSSGQGSQGQVRTSEPVPEPSHEVTESATDGVEAPPSAQHREPERASSSGIQGAIEEVNQIIQNLREVLDEMDGVLETPELAERQKNADEREIESLRRALRQVHRPRESVPHEPKGHA